MLFIAGGLILTWIGAALSWAWIRNPWFRYLHLGAIAFVAAEALLGIACPLTVWEDLLRGGARAESFVGRWVRALLYYRMRRGEQTRGYATHRLEDWMDRPVAEVRSLVLAPV